MELDGILDKLETFHGPRAAAWPTDPYLFIVWWHCGYPASDAACAKGWASLENRVGTGPEELLAASQKELADALRPGGMVPELRAMRLQEVALRVQREFEGDLAGGLKRVTVEKARAALKKFPNIADPGADRILLFAGVSPAAAVPSNCPHVLVRIQSGRDWENYGRTYTEAQEAIREGTRAGFPERTRAYLLLKEHGQTVCKRTKPKCEACAVAEDCKYAAANRRTTR